MSTNFEHYASSNAAGLVRAAYLLTGNKQDAEDLAQETLLKTFRSWRRVSRALSPDAYIHQTMVNAYLSQKRRRTVATEEFRPDNEKPGADMESRVVQVDQVASAISKLPPRERCAVVLKHFSGLTNAEVANAMGVAESSARSLICRAHKSLQIELEPNADPIVRNSHEPV